MINSNFKEDELPILQEKFGEKLVYLNERGCFIKRNHLTEFLNQVSKHYNLFLYSHGAACYVQEVLELIDPKRLINRERIFLREEGSFKAGQRKNLENLHFSESEFENILIFDDQPGVWEPSQQQFVIASKRFAPLCLKDDQKYRYFDIGILEGIDVFAEHLEGNQLKIIGDVLATLAKTSKSKKILENSALKPLRGQKIQIEALKKSLNRILIHMATRLGAEITQENPEILVVPENLLDEEKKLKVENWKNEDSLREVKDFTWLCHIFFGLNGKTL